MHHCVAEIGREGYRWMRKTNAVLMVCDLAPNVQPIDHWKQKTKKLYSLYKGISARFSYFGLAQYLNFVQTWRIISYSKGLYTAKKTAETEFWFRSWLLRKLCLNKGHSGVELDVRVFRVVWRSTGLRKLHVSAIVGCTRATRFEWYLNWPQTSTSATTGGKKLKKCVHRISEFLVRKSCFLYWAITMVVRKTKGCGLFYSIEQPLQINMRLTGCLQNDVWKNDTCLKKWQKSDRDQWWKRRGWSSFAGGPDTTYMLWI